MHVLRSIARSLDLNTRLKSTVTSTDEIDLRIDLHRQTPQTSTFVGSWAVHEARGCELRRVTFICAKLTILAWASIRYRHRRQTFG